MVKRRDILVGAAAVATGGAVLGTLAKGKKTASKSTKSAALSTPALSKNRRQLRLVTSWPKDFPGLGQMPNYFADALSQMSEGTIEVKVYAAGELVGALECFDAVATGGRRYVPRGGILLARQIQRLLLFYNRPDGHDRA